MPKKRRPMPRVDGESFALEVLRCADGESWHVQTLSEAYSGCLTHYKKGGSVWCNPEGCNSPLHRAGTFWKGYFAALVWVKQLDLWLPFVWELTEKSELDVRGKFARGQEWKFSRLEETTDKHEPTRGVLIGKASAAELPEAFEIMPTVRNLYHCQALVLGVDNPCPPRTMVQVIKAPPPSTIAPKASESVPSRMTIAEMQKQLAGQFSLRNGHKEE